MTVFTKEMLTKFVHMSATDWRSLTVSMGVMYRVRLNRETHIVDRVREIFGDNIPTHKEWDEVRAKLNKVRRQVDLAKQKQDEDNGVATDDSPRARKRKYQREYMRMVRNKRKELSAGD